MAVFDEDYTPECNTCENYHLSKCSGKAERCNAYVPVRAATFSELLRVAIATNTLLFIAQLITMALVIKLMLII